MRRTRLSLGLHFVASQTVVGVGDVLPLMAKPFMAPSRSGETRSPGLANPRD
jgi:hypothetical protein